MMRKRQIATEGLLLQKMIRILWQKKEKEKVEHCCTIDLLPSALKTGHFYFGNNRTFLLWLDKSKFFVDNGNSWRYFREHKP